MIKRVTKIPQLMYEVRPSKTFLGQVATFAVRNIKKGTVLDDADTPEDVVYLAEKDFKKLDTITQRKIERFCILEEGEYCLPADLNNLGSSWYFNHGCQANVGFDKRGSFIASRDIKKNEELFLDYGRMFTNPKFKMKCACGAKNCRGIITGSDWLNPEFRKNNLIYMWPDMRELPAGKMRGQATGQTPGQTKVNK
jgi:hypothetical protein